MPEVPQYILFENYLEKQIEDGGGGGLPNPLVYSGESVSLTATGLDGNLEFTATSGEGSVRLISTNDGNVRLTSGDSSVQISTDDIQILNVHPAGAINIFASDNDSTIEIRAGSNVTIDTLQDAGSININASGGADSLVELTSSANINILAPGAFNNSTITIQAAGSGGNVTIASASGILIDTGGTVQVSAGTGNSVLTLANDGNETMLLTPGSVEIACNGGDTSIDLTPTNVTISAPGSGGEIDLSAEFVFINGLSPGGEIFVQPTDFLGTGSANNKVHWTAFDFTGGSTQYGVTQLRIPEDWNTFNVEVWLSSTDANVTHDFAFDVQYKFVAFGGVIDDTPVDLGVILMPNNAGVVNGLTGVQPVALTNIAKTGNNLFWIRFQQSNADSTVVGVASIIGLRIHKVS